MQYGKVIPARFLSRPNRFVANVETEAGPIVCHVKNTGRCRELLVPGATVYLAAGTNPNRKTAWDLIAVEKKRPGMREPLLINMDAQLPNLVFGEWVRSGGFRPDVQAIRPEYRYGDSRLDFCLETQTGRQLVEVKGVTLETDGAARFPDAPTERGVRHIRELQRAVREGLQATLFFVVQMAGMVSVAPNDATHPAFGQALREAAAEGVRVEARGCHVWPDRVEMDGAVPVLL